MEAQNKTDSFIKHRNLPLLLLQAREQVFKRFKPLLKTVGLTEQQWRIVRALLDHGPLEPRQIGEICCLTSPSLAGILARMDETQLINRERFANDQRRVLVTVSKKGKKIAATLGPKIEATYKQFESEVGRQLSKNLYETLDTLLKKLS
ncbi:MAG: homoprotocatechuate degradation operon regulator HpaR [Betaproteobacteria bacterium]